MAVYALFGLISLMGVYMHYSNDQLLPAIAAINIANLAFIPVPPVGLNTGPHAEWLNTIYPLNYSGWSLAFELLINALYFLTLPILKQTRYIVIAISLSAAALRVLSIRHTGLDAGVQFREFPVGMARVSFSFFTGVLLCRLNRHIHIYLPPYMVHVCLAALMLILGLPQPEHLNALLDIAVVVIVIPLLLLAASACEPARPWRAAMTSLGAVSYCVYVMQLPLLPFAAMLLDGLRIAPSLLMGSVYVLGLYIAATYLDRYFDRPVRAWLGRLFSETRGIKHHT